MANLNEEIDSNIQEYLSTDPDDMDYDDALKLDKRKFCQFFFDKLKVNQMILNTFYTKDPLKPRPLKITRHTSNNNISIFELEMEKEYVYGHRYVVVLEGFPLVNLDVSEAINFPDFDKDFTYDGDDLGAIYSKDETKFNLWAPLASEVILKIEENDAFFFPSLFFIGEG